MSIPRIPILPADCQLKTPQCCHALICASNLWHQIITPGWQLSNLKLLRDVLRGRRCPLEYVAFCKLLPAIQKLKLCKKIPCLHYHLRTSRKTFMHLSEDLTLSLHPSSTGPSSNNCKRSISICIIMCIAKSAEHRISFTHLRRIGWWGIGSMLTMSCKVKKSKNIKKHFLTFCMHNVIYVNVIMCSHRQVIMCHLMDWFCDVTHWVSLRQMWPDYFPSKH